MQTLEFGFCATAANGAGVGVGRQQAEQDRRRDLTGHGNHGAPAGRSDRRQSLPTTLYTDVIIAEIHHAINKLGGLARPATPNEAQRALPGLAADVDLRSIVDSWGDTLPDEQILHLLRNWNAGLPLFQAIYASKPQDDDYGTGRQTSEDDE